jgi:hypothetical protein
MSWTPSIRCVGRRYPNAPATAKVGCLERPPGYWFVGLPAFTGVFSTFGTTWYPIRWTNTLPAFGFDPVNTWFYQHVFIPPQGATVQVWTQIEGGAAVIYYSIRTTGAGWPFRAIRYKRTFAAGFPRWVSSMDLSYDEDQGWIFGKPATVALYTPVYGQCAPGICQV